MIDEGEMRPRIGLNCDIEIRNDSRTRVQVWDTYHQLITLHGGVPLIMPPEVDPAEVAPILDGVLLIGGDDYRCALPDEHDPPERFVAVHPLREEADLRWGRFLLTSELPVFAICGGFQAMVYAAGGKILGDIESEMESEMESTVIHRRVSEEGELPIHQVRWNGDLEDGPVAGNYPVNSSHHQAVSSLPSGWSALATAEDGVIEGACDQSGRLVGVQWHPELMVDESLSRQLVERFFRSCNLIRAGRG